MLIDWLFIELNDLLTERRFDISQKNLLEIKLAIIYS